MGAYLIPRKGKQLCFTHEKAEQVCFWERTALDLSIEC